MEDYAVSLKKNEEREKNDFVAGHKNFFIVCKIESEREIHDLAVLKEYLDKVGIEMNLSKYPSGYTLSFGIDKNEYDRVVKRNAGRKKDYDMADRYKDCKVSELKKKLKTMKKTEIIKELGCPKTTFYRLLKVLPIDEDWADDCSIWNFK